MKLYNLIAACLCTVTANESVVGQDPATVAFTVFDMYNAYALSKQTRDLTKKNEKPANFTR